VTVQGIQWQTRKLSKKKMARVLVVSFSGGLDPSSAATLGNYHLVAAGKDKKFGTRDDTPVPLVAAAYDPAAHTVTLTPRGTVRKQTLQLSITASSLLDASEQPLDGNRDGQPGGGFAATFGNAGIRLASVPHPGHHHTISAEALDALLAAGRLHARRALSSTFALFSAKPRNGP
jgi:hypothetical protein